MQPMLIILWIISINGVVYFFGGPPAKEKSDINSSTFGFRKFEATVLSPYQMMHVREDNADFVRSHVAKELQERGMIDAPDPDIFVDIYVHLKLERQATSGYAGSFESGRITSGVSIYEVGTLIIRLVDSQSNQMLWEGSRTIPLWRKKEERIRKKVDGMVAKIFRNFDPEAL